MSNQYYPLKINNDIVMKIRVQCICLRVHGIKLLCDSEADPTSLLNNLPYSVSSGGIIILLTYNAFHGLPITNCRHGIY